MSIIDKSKYITVYICAAEYLDKIKPEGIDLDKYLLCSGKNITTLSDVFTRFIYSSQNYQRMPNVIAFSSRKEEVGVILHDFDINAVSFMDPDDLYRIFRLKFNVTSEDSNHNSWKKWSKSIVDSAKFLKEFKDLDDFKGFVDCFDYNVHTSMALPLLISEKISGIGFALACDLLKELGFTRYPKPDVHLIEVFSSLGLSENNPASTFEEIVRMADICKEVDTDVTPYKVDKIIWLICSGHYYLENPEPKRVNHKRDFIEYTKSTLS